MAALFGVNVAIFAVRGAAVVLGGRWRGSWLECKGGCACGGRRRRGRGALLVVVIVPVIMSVIVPVIVPVIMPVIVPVIVPVLMTVIMPVLFLIVPVPVASTALVIHLHSPNARCDNGETCLSVVRTKKKSAINHERARGRDVSILDFLFLCHWFGLAGWQITTYLMTFVVGALGPHDLEGKPGAG